MVEDRNENLQPADGKNEQTEAQQNTVSGNTQNNLANDVQDERIEEEKKFEKEEVNEEIKLITKILLVIIRVKKMRWKKMLLSPKMKN